MQNLVTSNLKDQTSKVVNAVTNAKDIGYNEGLGKRVDDVVNQFEGIKIDYHNSKLDLNSAARQNKIMNADFKNAAKHLEDNTNCINQQLVPTIRQLIGHLAQGIKYQPGPVAKDVSHIFTSTTGKTVDQVISKEVKNKLVDVQADTKQASADAMKYAEIAQASVMQINEDIAEFKQLLQMYLIEFAILLGLVIVTPGWFKIITLMLTVTVILLFNNWFNNKED